MKILFLIDGLLAGGKERRVVELMKGLSNRTDLSYEVVVMNTPIHYKAIFDLPTQIHYLIRKHKMDSSVFKRFYKICKEYKPDVVHCWDGMTALIAVPVTRLLNIKLVNSMVTNTPVNQNIFDKNWSRAKITFPFSHLVIGNSLAGLKGYKAPPKRSHCIYNGMDLNRFKNLPTVNEIKRKIIGQNYADYFIVGMVAALDDRKDYDTLLTAAQILLSKGFRIKFLLVGDGKNFEKMKGEVKNEYKNEILFLGKQDKVEDIIQVFDVGVLLTNTRVHGEGISNSIIEYMALAKPVIATAGGGTVELIENGANGFLIEPFLPELLVEKIDMLIKDDALRKKMGNAGRLLIQEKFELNVMVNNYLRVYNQLNTTK